MKGKKNSGRRRSEFFWGWLFLLPTMAGLLLLNIIPILKTIYQSFFKTGAFGKGNLFIGLSNYGTLFQDSSVWQALWNTCSYTLVEVPVSIVISLITAVFLNDRIRGKSAWRTIYFLPMVAAPAAAAMVWRWLYNSEFGLFNHVLRRLGFPAVSWLSNPATALICVSVVGIWSVIGYNMVLFLAGLQEIPGDYYEAAQLDGAGKVKRFLHITLPLISPTMFFVTVTRIIGAMQVFDSIYMMMDRSNPALFKTQSLVYLFYKYSFVEGNKGYGSTIVMLLLAVIMVITAVQLFCQKKWVNYN